MMFGDELQSLSKLLTSAEEEAAMTKGSTASMTPADLVARASAPATVTSSTKVTVPAEKPKADPKAIWSEEEALDADDMDEADGRKRAKFDIIYKQAVGAEDVYLGLAGKTPGSADCESIVVKIELPGEKLSDIDLDVKEQQITLNAAKHKLRTYLPFKTKHKEGSAKFDSSKGILSVTLPVLKEDLF